MSLNLTRNLILFIVTLSSTRIRRLSPGARRRKYGRGRMRRKGKLRRRASLPVRSQARSDWTQKLVLKVVRSKLLGFIFTPLNQHQVQYPAAQSRTKPVMLRMRSQTVTLARAQRAPEHLTADPAPVRGPPPLPTSPAPP